MKCPNCLSLMKCISAINPVPGQPGRDRMDLHCSQNRDNGGRGCFGRCHMGVITEDPKEWICHEYNFSFDITLGNRTAKSYYLRGYDYLVDPYHQSFQRNPNERRTILSDFFGQTILSIDFIPISTGDDMHEEAWKLFYKLKDLIPFS